MVEPIDAAPSEEVQIELLRLPRHARVEVAGRLTEPEEGSLRLRLRRSR